MSGRCDRCRAHLGSKFNCIEVHDLDNRVSISSEDTDLCQSCYESFIVYFDNFMEEK